MQAHNPSLKHTHAHAHSSGSTGAWVLRLTSHQMSFVRKKECTTPPLDFLGLHSTIAAARPTWEGRPGAGAPGRGQVVPPALYLAWRSQSGLLSSSCVIREYFWDWQLQAPLPLRPKPGLQLRDLAAGGGREEGKEAQAVGGGWEERLPRAGSQTSGKLGCWAPRGAGKQEGLPPELWAPGLGVAAQHGCSSGRG